jgi:toxin-antitoxin system PIN domain toxin
MSGHLLDANALIALLWPRHEHHDRLRRWFSRHAAQGWATCAFTQSAFVRIACQPAFAGQALAVSEVSELLMRNAAHPGHRLLAMDFGMAEVLGCCTGGVVGHRQVTDAWLLTLAVRHAMKLLTLDRGVPSLLATDAERARHITLL